MCANALFLVMERSRAWGAPMRTKVRGGMGVNSERISRCFGVFLKGTCSFIFSPINIWRGSHWREIHKDLFLLASWGFDYLSND